MVPTKKTRFASFFRQGHDKISLTRMLKLPTIFFLISFSLLAVLHIVALELFLYWRFWWFDIPMHFFGGSVVSLGLFTLRDLRLLVPERWIKILPIVLATLAIALSWEVFEIYIGVPIEANYVVDTLTDLSMGILGAVVGYSIGISVRKL